MVLVDTSVWIEHLRKTDPLVVRLAANRVLVTHNVVVGEMAVGSYKSRSDVLRELGLLPCLATLAQADCLAAIERLRLWGRGLGWGDVQLVLSAWVTGARLYTFDEPLLRTQSEVAELNKTIFDGTFG